MRDASDMELLREYEQRGSETAFAELVHRHVNLVYCVALRHVGIAAQAEEITQAVFVVLAQKASSLPASTILEGWLHGTTRLMALSVLRGERRRQFREQEAYMQSIQHDPNTDAVWLQLAPLLDEALAKLGANDRDAVMLRFIKGRSVREIAVALNVNESAAQRRVLRAVEKLRKFITKRGVVVPTAVLTAAISVNAVRAAPAMLAKSTTAVAIMKGVAASGSTLTLVKSTLKLMAWTKLKTAAVVGVIAITAAGTVTITMQHAQTKRESTPYTFAGYASPEASVESMLWAGSRGDFKKLLESCTPELAQRFKNMMAGKSDEEIKDGTIAWANALAGYKITQKEVVSDTEVHLHIHATPSSDGLHSGKVVLVMKKIGNEWKQAGEL